MRHFGTSSLRDVGMNSTRSCNHDFTVALEYSIVPYQTLSSLAKYFSDFSMHMLARMGAKKRYQTDALTAAF